jgi:hypothetical protein
MNVSWLVQLIQTPIVVYTIVLTIAWTLIQLASQLSHKEAKIRISERILLAFLGAYVISALVVMLTDVRIFPLLHAIMLALTLWAILSMSSKRNAPVLAATLVVALMPVIVMVSIKHPLPLGDDARFIGFAAAIDSDGRWVSFKYPENPYYQFFHLIPALEYILASITGVSIESLIGIMNCYLTLKLALYLAYSLLLFLVMRKLVGGASGPLVAVLLLSITPPLALSQVIHQGYAIVLSLATLFVMLGAQDRGSRADAIAKYPLLASGVVAHATYTIMVLTFALPMIIASRRGARRITEAVGIMLVVSLAYWIYTYVMDVIMRPTVDAFNRLVDLITARAPPFYGVAQPWYGPEQQTLFIAWALVPSMGTSYILLSILMTLVEMASSMTSSVGRARSKRLLNRGRNANASPRPYVSTLGLLGLGGTVINFALRTLPTFGGRYFYWLYLLVLPLSVLVAVKISKRLLGLITCVALISAVSFYGVQDPTLSANMYGENIGWAERDSWSLALALSQQLNPSILAWIDPRLSTPLSSLKPSPTQSEVIARQRVAIVGVDIVGLKAASKDPGNVDWFMRYMGMNPQDLTRSLNKFDVVLSSAKYVGIWRASE